ncbi:sugar phosphate isomerase/epimerase [Clostridium estertheticum]|uniref:sugar phosphate isomerase/epimerase n=1 Tax=Clostridium estertheticum TaxID=238834 RepID=UPI001C7D4A15|nr:sugar phosphate isomerase/epimerase [Clostridium estertheticum]MBX4262137.1 sugar phosphate isomerase/epimerase [Clostridium estertheticum]WLC69008.1 sugar phosphate isomerase/epimerase [Clostridium estertheticum]
MNNFMIGMYGKFDYKKFDRDFRKDFYGVEACLFENESDIENLANEAKEKGFEFGIHFPLRAGISKLRDPQFLSLNEEVKTYAYKHIEEELIYIKQKHIKPKYILFHYPKPVILKENFDMSNWRFTNSSEYTYEFEYSYEKFKKNSEYLFQWLSEKSFEYSFIPVLEFDALNKYICEDNFLESMLEKYKNIKICLDTGRLHLQHKIDSDFNDIEIIKRFSKYTAVVHLWNFKLGGIPHFPALPNLKTEEGFAPIEDYLKIIREVNKNVKIMFEHRSDLVSDEELDSCYSWISEILE